MQFKAVVLSAFVALAAAETIQELVAQIPACTKQCLDDASKKINCATTDNKCQCGKIDDLTKAATPCIIGCENDDMSKTLEISGKICAKVGGAQVGDAVSSIASGASTAIGGALSTASAKATSVIGDITATASHSAAATSSPSPAAAANGRNMAGAGLAAAVVAFAL
ncbi:uncharacterized protein PG998_013553 [Apiospora kogelbergensis]|uniref:CFEM domain-containing protein n=1 Tax=Apiospora kogelbergensis TaxID=1337665 RepID=A0AAW0R0Z1_9PEZI